MPERKNYILYGQQLDPFGVKNWLGFNLSRGTGEYASSTQFAEVTMSPLCLQYKQSMMMSVLGALC